MVLITGHNIGDAKRRVDLHNIYLRRLKLVSYVETLAKVEQLDKVEMQIDVEVEVDECLEIEE
jgi:low-affinity ferrous iron transport protein